MSPARTFSCAPSINLYSDTSLVPQTQHVHSRIILNFFPLPPQKKKKQTLQNIVSILLFSILINEDAGTQVT